MATKHVRTIINNSIARLLPVVKKKVKEEKKMLQQKEYKDEEKT